MFKTTIRSTDRLFSQWIRRGGKCEICGRTDIKLEAAHYFSRRKESVRFDERNVHCLCFNCHQRSHSDKKIYTDFMIKKYGQDGLDRLELDSNLYKKRDDKMDLIILKQLSSRQRPW